MNGFSEQLRFVLVQLMTVLVASVLAGEVVTSTFLAGTALVLVGVYFGAISRTEGEGEHFQKATQVGAGGWTTLSSPVELKSRQQHTLDTRVWVQLREMLRLEAGTRPRVQGS